MNFYNSYLPFLAAQSLGFQAPTMDLSTLLTAQLTSLMLASTNSLNGKRQLTFDHNDDADVAPTTNLKKLKPCADKFAVNMLEQSFPNSKAKQTDDRAQMNVIVVDEDEDCLIVDVPVTDAYQNWNAKKGFGVNSHFSSVMAELHRESLRAENQQARSLFAKEPAIIVLDNDDEDQLTCESTPQRKQDALSNCSETLEAQRQRSDETSMSTLDKTEDFEAPVSVMKFATIPSFKLSVVNNRQHKQRKVKSVWRPEEFGRDVYEKWVETIGQAVGIQITNEEKIVKIIKDFDMNIENALENIKRKKAAYKNHFRVKKLSKK